MLFLTTTHNDADIFTPKRQHLFKTQETALQIFIQHTQKAYILEPKGNSTLNDFINL